MNLASYLWFLGRPTLYPEMFRRLTHSLTHPRLSRAQRELWKVQSAEWCASKACPLESVARDLEIEFPLKKVSEMHPEDWASAEKTAAACPARMGGASGAIDLLYQACLHVRAESVVETGVAFGWSSLAILLAMERMGRGALASSDMPYALRKNEDYVGCVVPARLRSRWTLVRLPDRDALPGLLRKLGSIDLAHYDSDKSERGRTFGYSILWSALRPGGLLISDEIHDNLAFRDFCAKVGCEPWVLKGPGRIYVGVLRKPV